MPASWLVRVNRLAAVAATCTAASAFACPVCLTSKDGNTAAYVSMTVMMSSLPLLAAGTLVYVVWSRSKKP